jgi:hypothetical protein
MGDEDRNYEDRRLEALLRARAGEPRAGLEERVLARIASEPKRRVFTLWPFAAVAAVIVVAIALIVLHSEMPKQHLAGQISQPEKPARPSRQDNASWQASLGSAVNNHEFQKHRRANSRHATCCVSTQTVAAFRGNGNREQLPKLATFPAPRPETEQERMLVRLATKVRSLNRTKDSIDSTDVAQLQGLSVPEFTIHAMEGEPPVNDDPQR